VSVCPEQAITQGSDPGPEQATGAEPAHGTGDVFDAGRDEHLDAARLQAALHALFRAYPEAPVSVLSSAGIFVEMPPSLNLKQNPVLEGRTGLDGLDSDTRTLLVKNWERSPSISQLPRAGTPLDALWPSVLG
jgi:hypothetical protein